MRVDGWAIFEAYRQLPARFRATLAVGLISLGGAMCWSGHRQFEAVGVEAKRAGRPVDPFVERRHRGTFQAGLFLTLFGCVVLMTSGRSRSERHGYHF